MFYDNFIFYLYLLYLLYIILSSVCLVMLYINFKNGSYFFEIVFK